MAPGSAAGGDGAVRVAIRFDPDADLIPRTSGGTVGLVAREGRSIVASGLMAGPFLVDLDGLGDVMGASVLEDRKVWARTSLGLELKARPHTVRIVAAPPLVRGEVRWDAERRLVAMVLDPDALDGEAPKGARTIGLGPRAHALLHGDALVALLGDLRGFGR